jgi:uncharacterized protein YbgA (DUF1722 family)
VFQPSHKIDISTRVRRKRVDDRLRPLKSQKDKGTPISAFLVMASGWIACFEEEYLRNQTFFESFPEEPVQRYRR